MKKTKILLACAILSAMLLTLVSCTVNGNEPSKTEESTQVEGTKENTDPKFERIRLSDKNKTYYPLIRPDVKDTAIIDLLSGTAA